MTDNSIIPVATGNETFANHDIGGIKYPRVRITWGASGFTNDADIAAGKGLPIQGSVSIAGTPTVVANVGTGTQPVSGTINVGAALPAGTAHIGEVKIDPTQLGGLVAGGIPVVSGGNDWFWIDVSQTNTTLPSTVTGSYLEEVLCIVATAATSQVQIKDGSGTARTILPNAVAGGVGSYPVPLGLISKLGGWQITTAAGVTVIASFHV